MYRIKKSISLLLAIVFIITSANFNLYANSENSDTVETYESFTETNETIDSSGVGQDDPLIAEGASAEEDLPEPDAPPVNENVPDNESAPVTDDPSVTNEGPPADETPIGDNPPINSPPADDLPPPADDGSSTSSDPIINDATPEPHSDEREPLITYPDGSAARKNGLIIIFSEDRSLN